MQKRSYIKELVNRKMYPFQLAGALFCITAFFMVIVYLLVSDHKYIWTVFGIELLFYMLVNAFSSLMVDNAAAYMKKVVIAYTINLILCITLLVILLGSSFREYAHTFPAFEALIFCFFSSLILITLIRTVVNFFKDE